MKKIMILTAERTGTGHKSAANALEKKFNILGYEIKQVDAFKLMGKLGEMLENSYTPITLKFPLVFYLVYLFSQTFPSFIHSFIFINLRKKLKKEIIEYKPDLIISVHCMFTKSVSHLLRKEKIDIPFYIDVIDLVKPPNVWFDKSADMIFVPTGIIENDYIEKGFDKDKLILSGFPIRDDIVRRTTPKKVEDKVNILLVNPSVHLRKNIIYVKEVSKLENVDITVICGRDRKLYKELIEEQKTGKLSQDIKIYDFVTNMNEFLENTHILLTKAGPNMMLEGARSATAIVVTGHIQGQENNNYKYVIDNDLGFKCENPFEIYDKLNKFITSGKLNECLKNALNSDCNNGTEIIVKYIDNRLNNVSSKE